MHLQRDSGELVSQSVPYHGFSILFTGSSSLVSSTIDCHKLFLIHASSLLRPLCGLAPPADLVLRFGGVGFLGFHDHLPLFCELGPGKPWPHRASRGSRPPSWPLQSSSFVQHCPSCPWLSPPAQPDDTSSPPWWKSLPHATVCQRSVGWVACQLCHEWSECQTVSLTLQGGTWAHS